MASGNQEVGRYVLPIIPSIDGIGPSIDKTLGKAFGNVSKQASKVLTDGVQSGVAQAEADIKKASDAIAKLRDKEAAAVDKLATAEARINEVREKGGSALKRAEAQRNAAMREQASVLRQIESQTRSLGEAQERLGNSGGASAGGGFLAGFKGATRGIGGAGSEAAAGFAEGFAGSSALLRLGSAAGPVGLALTAAGVIGGGLLVKSVLAGIERQPAKDLIQAQLGLDPASMAKLSQSAAKAYTDNFGESVQDNLSTAKTALRSGLLSSADDPSTQHVIEQLSAVSQILGEEIPATARAAGQLIKTGLADSADQAFDLIVKGEQAGLNSSEDLLDTFNEYGTQFRKLGLSGPEAIGLLSQALKGGARDSDKAADALKEFSIRSVDGSKTTMQAYRDLGFSAKAMSEEFAKGGPAAHDAFGQILTEIRRIDDPLKRGQVAAALFGTQWEDLGGAFDKFDLSNAVNELGQVDGAAQRASDTMSDNVVSSFEQSKRSIQQSISDVEDKLAEAFGPSLKQAADWAHEHTDDIAEFFANMGIAGISVAQDIVKSTGQMVVAVGQFVGVIGDIQGAVTKFQAWQADIRGDHDQADELRREADEYFGWGESLQKVGNDMVDGAGKMDDWKQSLRELKGKAGDTKDETHDLSGELKDLPKDTKVNLTYSVTDAQGNPIAVPLPPIGGTPNAPTTLPNIAGVPFPGFTPTPSSSSGGGAAAPGINIPGLTPLPGIRGAGGMGPGGRPVPGSGFMPYGLKAGTDTGGYGSSGPAFPEWVHQIEQQFGVKASTYKNHQESDPSDPRDPHHGENYAANPQHLNRGIDWSGSVENMQRLAEWLQSIAPGTPQLEQIIWQNPKTMQRIGLGGAGNLTTGYYPATGEGSYQEHQNHVHTRQSMAIPLSGGGSTTSALGFTSFPWDDVAQAESSGNWQNADTGKNGHYGGLQFSPDTWKLFGGLEFAPSPEQASREQQIEVANRAAFTGYNGVAPQGLGAWQAITDGKVPGVSVNSTPTMALSQSGPGSPNLVSAFGNQYKAGIGTPGYNEYGEPGYYETDPRQIAQAQRRAEDTQRQIEEADQRIADAKKKRADLEDEINVTAEDRAQADKDIADAEREAKRAREDAEWAKQDAVEAQQGKFKAAQKAKGGKNGDGGDLSGIGGIFGSFLKETFGIDGSLFPDLADLMPIKMGGALLSAFKGPILGAAQGQLGIQQPGWQPGMPTQIPDAGSGSGLPFGMVPSPFDFAGNAQPGMAPPGSPASGIGSGPAPGPVDNSRNLAVTVNGGPNEDQIANTVRREVSNVQRVATYTAPGA